MSGKSENGFGDYYSRTQDWTTSASNQSTRPQKEFDFMLGNQGERFRRGHKKYQSSLR